MTWSRYDISAGVARFRILCVDGGVAYHCSSLHPGHNGTVFHAGQGVLDVGSRLLQTSFDNLARNRGNASVNFTTISWNDTSVWRRVPASGQETAISLGACAQPHYIRNRDGRLSCDWQHAPPPRVGTLLPVTVGSGNTSVTGGPDATCRYLPQHTFMAPQYRRDAPPLLTFSTLNSSTWHPPWNLDGGWSSFNRDGATMLDAMQVCDGQAGRQAGRPPPPPPPPPLTS
jgi:hypothetical protein